MPSGRSIKWLLAMLDCEAFEYPAMCLARLVAGDGLKWSAAR